MKFKHKTKFMFLLVSILILLAPVLTTLAADEAADVINFPDLQIRITGDVDVDTSTALYLKQQLSLNGFVSEGEEGIHWIRYSKTGATIHVTTVMKMFVTEDGEEAVAIAPIETQEIVEKLTKLIQEQNEFVTYYYEGSFLVKYDSRCKDLMIYPSRFDIEIGGGSLLTTSYGWAIVDNPDSTKNPAFQIDNLLLIRALFHRSLSEHTKALSYFKKAAQVSTKNINVYFEMGNTLFIARSYQEAINCWQKCIDITDNDRDKSQVYFNIGCGYAMLNRMKQAADIFRNALALGLDRSIIESDPTLAIFRNSKEYAKIYKLSLQ